jgi:hypothetical protein
MFKYVFAWAWIIIIGALMITPGGVSCIACGEMGSRVFGVINVLIGAVGLVATLKTPKTAIAR